MWPADLEVIYDRVNNLTGNLSAFPYPENSRPFVYQEVIDVSPEAVSKFQYNDIAAVIEFSFGVQLGSAFRGQDPLDKFKNWGTGHYGLLPSEDALVMVDNHDNQRGHGAGGATILTYKNYREYKVLLHLLNNPRPIKFTFLLFFIDGFVIYVISSIWIDARNELLRL